jgi:Trypsin-co-occurring domain 1
VLLPSGDPVWVRVQAPAPAAAGERTSKPVDVGLGKPIDSAAEALRLPGFAETIRGVVATVREALNEHRPDSLSVEFGIEITARAGSLLSVLAEVGGTAQVRVTASWDRSAPAKPPIPGEEPERG